MVRNANKSELKTKILEQNKKVVILFCILTIFCASIVMVIYQVSNDQNKYNKDINNEFEIVIQNDTTFYVEVIEFIGDGYCDDEYNIEEYFYDMGDCCDFQNPDSYSTCSSCTCQVNISNWLESMKCSTFSHIENGGIHGNGYCDPSLNNIENFFDAGDCCISDSGHDCISSNLFCDEETLGDGICQDFNNSSLCDYDLGDCCIVNQPTEDCCLCKCKLTQFFDILK